VPGLVQRSVQASTDYRGGRDKSRPPKERTTENSNRKQVLPGVCSTCTMPSETDSVACTLCKKSYHLYCVEPPLLYPPAGPWICQQHVEHYRRRRKNAQVRNAQGHLPSTRIPLDFSEDGAVKLLNAMHQNSNPQQAVEQITEAAELLMELHTRPQERQAPVRSLRSVLHDIQSEMRQTAAAALGNGQQPTLAEVVRANHTLAGLTPMFVQFLAWQRLMQLQESVPVAEDVGGRQPDPSPEHEPPVGGGPGKTRPAPTSTNSQPKRQKTVEMDQTNGSKSGGKAKGKGKAKGQKAQSPVSPTSPQASPASSGSPDQDSSADEFAPATRRPSRSRFPFLWTQRYPSSLTTSPHL
jgi:hypothetical protein